MCEGQVLDEILFAALDKQFALKSVTLRCFSLPVIFEARWSSSQFCSLPEFVPAKVHKQDPAKLKPAGEAEEVEDPESVFEESFPSEPEHAESKTKEDTKANFETLIILSQQFRSVSEALL